MSLTNSVLIMGAKVVMGAIAQDVNLTVAFLFPTLMMFGAGLISARVAKRAVKTPGVVDDAFPMTGPIGIIATED
jgi:hypothetical protein